VVVSVAEKAHGMRQVRAGKANVSEPLLKRRKRSGVIKTGVQSLPRDEPGGCLLTGQVVTGVKVARARFRHQHGTWEPVAPMVLAGCWAGRPKGVPRAAETARGRVPVRGTGADRLVVAVKVCHERGEEPDVGRASGSDAAWKMKVVALQSRPAGGGSKPPHAALAEDCRGERCGKRRP